MSPSTCPTVRVVSPKSPGGFKVINESDLTSADEIWSDDLSEEAILPPTVTHGAKGVKKLDELSLSPTSKSGGQHSPQNRS